MLRTRLSLSQLESRENPNGTIPLLDPVTGGTPLPPPVNTVVIQPPATTTTTTTGTIITAATGGVVGTVQSVDPLLGINPLTGLPFVQ